MPPLVPKRPGCGGIPSQGLLAGTAGVGQNQEGHCHGGLQAVGQGEPPDSCSSQKQAKLAQPGGDSGSAGDESRPAGLEPGAEPVSQRLRCLKYQAYAVEKGNGTAFSLSRPLQKEPPQDQNSQGGGQPHPQSGAQGYAAVLRVQHQLGNQYIVQPQGAQGQEKPCHGGGVLDFSKAAGPQAPGGGHAYPQVQKSQENFSADDPDGVGRRLPGAHGNHRSGRMGAGLQGPSE